MSSRLSRGTYNGGLLTRNIGWDLRQEQSGRKGEEGASPDELVAAFSIDILKLHANSHSMELERNWIFCLPPIQYPPGLTTGLTDSPEEDEGGGSEPFRRGGVLVGGGEEKLVLGQMRRPSELGGGSGEGCPSPRPQRRQPRESSSVGTRHHLQPLPAARSHTQVVLTPGAASAAAAVHSE
ncbi:hypothetical protein HU200_015063 [Digitaria exilis]|uniref:Uncharacterized protein n=1 Tax=Digitaria exilis TaxID=1010633 RepID=A0A835F9C8_9POAL|nr:hypothetical protein HU200_015063 [Digitaria exilis]